MADDTPWYVGVDIGGTKIAAGVVSADGTVAKRVRVPTPRSGSSDVLATVTVAVADLVSAVGSVNAIGVGAPGVIDRSTGRVVSASAVLPGWAGAEVAASLQARFAVPVGVDNDVSVAALGEARFGAGTAVDRLLVLSLGTGVGGALVFGGQLQRGNHGTAGELAHVLAPSDGPLACGCGRRDHFESHCCGPAIEAFYHRAARDCAGTASLPEIVERAREGEQLAARVLDHAGSVAGRAVAGIASAVDIDGVVVTGGVAQIGAMLLDPLRDAFAESVIGPLREIPVVVGSLGGDAPILGAVTLAMAL